MLLIETMNKNPLSKKAIQKLRKGSLVLCRHKEQLMKTILLIPNPVEDGVTGCHVNEMVETKGDPMVFWILN